MVVIDRLRPVDGQPAILLIGHTGDRLGEHRVVGRYCRLAEQAGQIVTDGVRQHEVAVSQALHEGTRSEAVGAMVREVGLTDRVQARHRGHQVVVHPKATHRVVDGRIDPHRLLVWVLTGNPVVHIEQVPVLLGDGIHAVTGDGYLEVKEHTVLQWAYAPALVTHRFGITRRHVTWHQVSKGRVFAFQVVVAFSLGDLGGHACVVVCVGYPDATIVA